MDQHISPMFLKVDLYVKGDSLDRDRLISDRGHRSEVIFKHDGNLELIPPVIGFPGQPHLEKLIPAGKVVFPLYTELQLDIGRKLPKMFAIIAFWPISRLP